MSNWQLFGHDVGLESEQAAFVSLTDPNGRLVHLALTDALGSRVIDRLSAEDRGQVLAHCLMAFERLDEQDAAAYVTYCREVRHAETQV